MRDNSKLSGSSKMLCVSDLPKQAVIDGQNVEFEYGNFVSGDINVVDGDLIQAGVHVSLLNGSENMFAKYETCFLTLCSSTCYNLSEWTVFRC